MDFISIAFSNRETAKSLEFHEIFESRIPRILLDIAEYLVPNAIPCVNRYSFLFFASFFFISWFRDSNDDSMRFLLIPIMRNT